MAHPDDAEFGCSGSVTKWVEEGATAYYLILTDGSKGSENPAISSEKLIEIRKKEQNEAARVLGVKEVFFFDYIDGELENNSEVRTKIVHLIRQLKPDTVVAWDPTFVYDANAGFVNHPDHRIAGQATLDSVFPFARNSRTFPDLLANGLQIHHVKEILLINFCKNNYYIDISSVLDKKIEALGKHKSQHGDKAKIQKMITSIAKRYGQAGKMKYAEGFMRIVIKD